MALNGPVGPPWRNAHVLAAANAINGAAPIIAVTLGGLTGAHLLGVEKTLATLPVTGLNLGVAVAAIPAATLMRQIGRRTGFITGALFGIGGGLGAAVAVVVGSFWLFSLALFTVGCAWAFQFQYRFAAGEGGDEAFRAKAVSWVLAGGVVSAIVGPQAVILTRDWLSPVPFAGAFIAQAILSTLGLSILFFLSEPPPPAAISATKTQSGRPLSVISRQPRFLVAVLCGMLSYGVMSLVMTAAPIAMVGCGLTANDAALGIQWHVLAMFAPSSATGNLIARFGKTPTMVIGLVLLAACGIAGLSGLAIINFWGALVLLGVGWNFTFIGATAMLGETYRPEEKGRVEGLNDFLVFGIVVIASLTSGSLVTGAGWDWVNYAVFPIVAVCLLALVSLSLASRRTRGQVDHVTI